MNELVNDQPPILLVHNLNYRTEERALFTGMSATIPAGVTLVCGGEGSGKTTLLRLLAAELAADSGALQIGDAILNVAPAAYRQQVFWADPRSDAFEQTTPRDYFSSLPARFPAFDPQALERLITGLSLTPHMDKKLFMLSTGSKRKVWLAAAFASGAAVMLIDEPFVALDSASVAFVMTLLMQTASAATRACVMANYEAPAKVPLAATIDLGD